MTILIFLNYQLAAILATPMKIAYVTAYDALDISNWSGLGHYIAKSLTRQSIELSYIGSLREPFPLFFKGKQLAYRLMAGRRHLREREPAVLKHYAEQVADKLKGLNVDAVFSPGTLPISSLETGLPIIFWTDATFAGMIDFYPEFSNLSEAAIRNGARAEQAALSKASLAIYASDWAAKTAIENYQATPSKIKVVPFGANIECDRSAEDIKRLIDLRSSRICKLLFVGADWRRKGGPLALEVAKQLNEQGLKTELTIVGCEPQSPSPAPDYVKSIGFIDKNIEAGRKTLDKLFAESHFLIMPSRAECFGVVFCEAGSFGLPSLASDVGGITTAVRSGVNGKTFTIDASADDYCAYISNLMSDRSGYEELALSSFREFETRLNWETSGAKVRELIDECISR